MASLLGSLYTFMTSKISRHPDDLRLSESWEFRCPVWAWLIGDALLNQQIFNFYGTTWQKRDIIDSVVFWTPQVCLCFFWNSTCFQLECSTLLTYLIPFGGQYRLPAHAPHAVSISPWLSDDAAWKLTPREKGDLFLEIIASGYMLNTFMVLELKHCYTGLWIF